ncbi:hypothetical protein [Psychromicrobium lacuslunae]|uniref:SHOCT domain-containing protein n=1 Tax=Psychromicrobium lacuslunae TaxID=1618207 RepID=A0A0D4BZG6_9MICC|nr:hypothetical protein [Psychromicrobium lacuslunae]AJT41842.1 hypothetical protein UM93_10535 [Psychromicrobium lacuslunae]
MSKSRRYIVRGAKAAAGTVLAAATVAAMTAFAPVPSSTASSSTARLAGVHQDLTRAIELRQLTPEQAEKFEKRLLKQINQAEN